MNKLSDFSSAGIAIDPFSRLLRFYQPGTKGNTESVPRVTVMYIPDENSQIPQ